MKTLDRSRPYGTVFGGSVAHAFEQDGLKFDTAGDQVIDAQDSAPAAAVDAGAALNIAPEIIAAAAKVLDQAMAKVMPEIADASDHLLAAMRAGEAAGKGRKTLIEAIDAEIAKRAGGAEDQLSQQLGA